MDRDSRSPEIETRERAVSSEPTGTRPNPFEDGDESSRKRRRTSTIAGSRSRSVETVHSSKGCEAGSNTSPPTTATSKSPPTVTEDGTMTIDTSLENTPESAPHTPDNAAPPAHVTLSLRNSAHRVLDTIPSSPCSTPQSPIPALPVWPPRGNGTTLDAEPYDTAPMQHPAILGISGALGSDTAGDSDSLRVSRSDTTSPPVEVVGDQPEDDADFDIAQTQVTLLPDEQDEQGGVLVDPSGDFPYQNAAETHAEIMAKLINYMSTDVHVAQHIRTWIDSYLLFAKSTPFDIVLASYRQHRALWFALPDLVWGVPNLRSPTFAILDEVLRERLLDFCESFAHIAAYFVEFDFKILQQSRSPDELQPRDFISSHYLIALSSITRREVLPRDDDRIRVPERDEITDIMDRFLSFYDSPPCGTLLLLDRLLQAQIAMMPTTPRIIENLGQICVMASFVVREAGRKLVFSNHRLPGATVLNSRIALGHDIFKTASAALSTIIENHITHLTYDNASQQISALGDMILLCLKADNTEAAVVFEEFQSAHPDVRTDFIPDVYAMEWRFGMFCRLIMCSQMQLRVMAVTNLCQELVSCWRRYGEHLPESARGAPVLKLVSNFLAATGVVAYLLGPTCHPEITAESGNIIGFLAVTRTYTNEHTDLFWQTVTNTQDPRISEALLRMTCRTTHLFSYDAAIYLCQKLLELPISAYNQTMREFCDAILRHVSSKPPPEGPPLDTIPFAVCLHILRESSVSGLKAPTAYPELQSFAIEKLGELLKSIGIEPDQRQILYRSCLTDIREKSPTTLGSLCAINIINRHFGSRDLAMLTTEDNLTELLVNDIENAVIEGLQLGSPAVISGNTNSPRRDTIFQIVVSHASTLTPELSARLWNVMVGPGAACTNDRNASWKVLIACIKRSRLGSNPFLTLCFSKFLPVLPPSCFCEGLLEFVQDSLMPLVNDVSSTVLDDEDTNVDHSILEQLWRIVLTAPPGTIEIEAISLLVKDVYIESRLILSFPHHRARKVHLALVNRCLRHLSSAATKLKLYNDDGSSSRDDESLVVVPSDSQIHEQEALFVRSLCVLKEFHRLYRAKAYFSTPDLGSYLSESPENIKGEPAQLKYQSFDGVSQTEVKPLIIGRRNTAGSLLASLKEATGFDNYRVFYRGQAFMPRESDICRPLEDLRIHDGLILVKKESDPQTPPPQVRPGTSPVDIEILGHFKELWEYLSMEEKLAREIHRFLAVLPVEGSFLQKFGNPDLSYKEIFPIGQPYKSLYAVYGLREFLQLHRRAAGLPDTTGNGGETGIKGSHETLTELQSKEQSGSRVAGAVPASLNARASSEEQVSVKAYKEALATARRLSIAAICDPDVTQFSTNVDLQISLSSVLVDIFAFVLNEPLSCPPHADLDGTLSNRLMSILRVATDAPSTDSSIQLVKLSIEAIMDSCAASNSFWEAFKQHESVSQIFGHLLLEDQRLHIRQLVAKRLRGQFIDERRSPAVKSSEFRDFFWPIVESLIPKAIQHPEKCEDIFDLAYRLFHMLRGSKSPVLNMPSFSAQISSLVLSYTTFEDVTQPDITDFAAAGLLRVLSAIIRTSKKTDFRDWFPANFVNKLFWKHLFPPWQFKAENEEDGIYSSQSTFPRVLISPVSRSELIRIISELMDADKTQLPALTENLDQLVPCEKSDDDEPYHYDLPQQFDRTKALRAPCGYVGLRNLSNTCYLNSLLTQLFMNVEFRRFMMNVEIRDETNSQKLLFQTRLLFSFMQDSIRRYADTQQCVANIKTYDDTPIDIHSQMDVDEFYNLLFDRWEGQMISAETKRALRNFYGGQLVQQVKSKECEHVSERLEPFSAIQCDIKGKASLQESLQAYVDGEIMEGDNKYKCSTCDRHVDAVKRACLKDIPDNLILHLKRFDFNLRTLQRSKINDYFSFPHELDMRPYTIDQLSSPSEKKSADIFELVGVLVHSGTAESGHYYSYIRERPSSGTDAGWVEFNDDVVNTWDPSLLELSCFGGVDRRPSHFGGDGGGISIDKPYSAYMLFYQRASSLAKEQEALAASKRSSPVRMEVPAAIADHIRSENTSLVRRHCLFDPQHIPFVNNVLESISNKCSANHRLETLSMQMALSHLDQVASRNRDLPDFQSLLNSILQVCQRCQNCFLAVFEYFDERHDVLRQMVQRSPEVTVRQEVSNFLIHTLQEIKEAFPERYGFVLGADDIALSSEQMELDQNNSVLRSAAYMMQTLWEHIHVSLRSWYETFGFMVAFVRMGRPELAVFLDIDGLRRVVMAISADSSLSMEPQYIRMLQAVQRRLPNRPPSYENMIALADTLLAGMYPDRPGTRSREELFVDDNVSRFMLSLKSADGDLPMTRMELLLMSRNWINGYGNIFVEKLISINQNTMAADSIVIRLMASHPAMEGKVLTTLMANISSDAAAHYQEPFLRVAKIFLRHAKSADLVFQLSKYISEQCRGLSNTDGRAFFEALGELFYGRANSTDEVDQAALLRGLHLLPLWVPGLLGYYDTSVGNDVEIFLRENVFHFGTTPQFEDSQGGAERALALTSAARQLGLECLKYIKTFFVDRGVQVNANVVIAFQRVVAQCRPYYLEDDGEDGVADEFHALDSTVPEQLKRLVVEDLEEDASGLDDQDWNSSHCSSEPVDSLGDVSMQTAADLNDMDIP